LFSYKIVKKKVFLKEYLIKWMKEHQPWIGFKLISILEIVMDQKTKCLV